MFAVFTRLKHKASSNDPQKIGRISINPHKVIAVQDGPFGGGG